MSELISARDPFSVAVLGPGGVGGFLAASLDRTGTEVQIVARPSTAELIERRGVRVGSDLLGTFTARPAACALLTRTVDVLFIATKATALGPALDRIRAEPKLVVPLLNGIDHMEVLRERWGSAVIAATIRIQSDRPEAGVIVQTIPFAELELVAEGEHVTAVERTAALLRQAGIATRLRRSEPDVLWRKLIRLNALACTTSAGDRPIGWIRRDPLWRSLLRGCVEEGVAVAAAEGVRIDSEVLLAELDAAGAALGSSMRRDIANGREPELEAIPGAVLRGAARHGVTCPTIEDLVGRIRRRLY